MSLNRAKEWEKQQRKGCTFGIGNWGGGMNIGLAPVTTAMPQAGLAFKSVSIQTDRRLLYFGSHMELYKGRKSIYWALFTINTVKMEFCAY